MDLHVSPFWKDERDYTHYRHSSESEEADGGFMFCILNLNARDK
jgi:hypothetical protein